ncbi:PREDICTED: choline monooxygenase, chloroplastic isoform X3 [Tarenaya hassleriana]|uniref:choline monooxygenase, chloroplastic isoform X3 n=1 Tax=Tarenaya hassleriana TaxID=28532 RepID=UPI00053C3B9E|nr:PREDICTED: choline monooxygenase, chloroplastic isoform X3 [Tarenaya hassleriana]
MASRWLGDVEYLVCRDDNGKVHAFHNVCSHHASILASGSGKKSCFVCPYHVNTMLELFLILTRLIMRKHMQFREIFGRAVSLYFLFLRILVLWQGWTYGLSGSLVKATRMTGIENFYSQEMGLKPISVAVWGPFVLLNMNQNTSNWEEFRNDDAVAKDWLGSSANILSQGGVDDSLSYICRREYTIDCNWKVFCDNYLDGGYHVPYAHKGLASGLDLNSYSTTMLERVSIQECGGGSKAGEDGYDRLGSKALYAFIYPNFMINRYGPWMDTNLVIPLGPRKCKVVFDYFLEPFLKEDESFIERSLEESERVQMEDIVLCENVQRGLESPAYVKGRYAPVEEAMHHFHCLLHHNLSHS